MLNHYLTIILRNIYRDRVYSAVSIIGLGIGVMCSLLFLFWVRSELSYDKFHDKHSQIYRIISVEQKDGDYIKKSWTSAKNLNHLKEQFPEIEDVTFLSSSEHAISGENGNSILTSLCSTNDSFFNFFDFKFIEGSPESFLRGPNEVVISEDVARTLFGKEPALGRQINTFIGPLTVAGVVEIPSNTHIRFGVLRKDKHNGFGICYILFNKKASFTDETRAKMANIPLSTSKNSKNKLTFQPLNRVHLHSEDIDISINSSTNYGSMRYIYIYSIAVLFILLIAIINYVNIATARSTNRGKEVGVRKVLGSSRGQLIVRFLFESTIISLIAVVLALCLIELLLTPFGSLMGSKIVFSHNLDAFAISIGICLFTGLLSGLYAALYMSSLNPVIALKGMSQTGSKERLRKILLAFQFTLSIIIMLCTIIVYMQLDYIVNKNLGFDRTNVLRLNTGVWYEAPAFQKELEKNPNVINSTMSTGAPYNVAWYFNNIKLNQTDEHGISYHLLFADHRFANTFGLEILKGRYIPETTGIDEKTGQFSSDNHYIVINETMQKYLGVENPIGMKINGWIVIGVVKDFHFRPFQEAMSPLIIGYNMEEQSRLYIKVAPNDIQNTIKYIQGIFEVFKKDGLFQESRPFTLTYLEDEYRDMYKSEFRLMKILAIFAIISLFISCIGVISMVSFMVERRAKEIAIRKINGASIWSIIKLFTREFTTLIIIASLVATPIALLLMSNWLNSYIYRISISPLFFIIVIVFTLLVTLLTLMTQIYRAACKNPVKSLRSE